MLALALCTVDVDQTCVDMSKSMSLVTNTVILLLVQYFKNPGEHDNQGSATQISVMILQQTVLPAIITVVFACIVLVPLRMRLSNYVFERAHVGHVQEHIAEEEEIETEFDYILMLVIPLTSFLVAESMETCGFVPLTLICVGMRLYAKPNLTKERSNFLRLLTAWAS